MYNSASISFYPKIIQLNTHHPLLALQGSIASLKRISHLLAYSPYSLSKVLIGYFYKFINCLMFEAYKLSVHISHQLLFSFFHLLCLKVPKKCNFTRRPQRNVQIRSKNLRLLGRWVWRFINQFIMRQGDRVCISVSVKTEKELEGFKRREERRMEGVPRIVVGKFNGVEQEIWMDPLHNEPVAKIKELSAGQRGLWYAQTIVTACCGLANYYGYYIINENMVFFNNQREIFVWINPDLRENHVKIYLPHTHEGELAMIRSIISFLKLWLKYDYALLADVKHLPELVSKLQHPKRPEGFKARSPGREFMGGRRNSVNLESGQMPMRVGERMPLHGQQLLMENRSTKQACRSPTRDNDLNFLTSSISNKPGMKFNQLTAETEKGTGDFQHRSFNSNNNIAPLTKSIGMNSNSNYFPNKTTSNKHHIVSMINKLDSGSGEYVKNKLLLDDERMKDLQREKLKKMKESLDGIGEELNDLFVSNIENEEEDPQSIKNIQEQFENLLG